MAHEFSCCGFYMACNYGKNECYFDDSEPLKKRRCRCYRIKHGQSLIDEEIVASEIVEKEEEQQQLAEFEPLKQLSLF